MDSIPVGFFALFFLFFFFKKRGGEGASSPWTIHGDERLVVTSVISFTWKTNKQMNKLPLIQTYHANTVKRKILRKFTDQGQRGGTSSSSTAHRSLH